MDYHELELEGGQQVLATIKVKSDWHDHDYDPSPRSESRSVPTNFSSSNFGTICAVCNSPVKVPWIRCVKCNPQVDICSQCFSFGVEFGQHESDHPYTVISFNFPLFEASWTVAEELQLLEAVQECGLGNWAAVSQRLRTKTEAECERHYFKCYIEKPHSYLPDFPEDPIGVNAGAPVIFKLSDNPPRPPEGSSLWAEMGGYSAARDEFSVEHDNFVEIDISTLTNDEDSGKEDSTDDEDKECSSQFSTRDKALERELKMAVIDVYRNCLKERQRRKRIVRDYGLINLRKWFVFFQRRFQGAFSVNNFRPFMRLFPPETFDKYMESFCCEKYLKNDISKLQEYRRNGIQHLHSVKYYRIMKQRRDQTRNQKGLLNGVLNHIKDEMSCQAWLARQAVLGPTNMPPCDKALPNAPRKSAPPLYIEDLPGYSLLNEDERELCATVRLVPQAFLDFSKILVAECRKKGFLRLAHARTLIKIDVNKTRKVYDFLCHHGLINKEPL